MALVAACGCEPSQVRRQARQTGGRRRGEANPSAKINLCHNQNMTYTHSHFGVYAVITDDTQEKILLIKKARGPYTGLYDLPGGSPEATELLDETLKREVLEETGCTITQYTQMGGFSCRYNYKIDSGDALLRHLGVLYTAQISGKPTTMGDGQDSNGCVWMNKKDLSQLNATPFVLQALTHTK